MAIHTVVDQHMPSDLGLLKARIDDQVKVLSSLPPASSRSASRQDLLADLLRDLASYYEYSSELMHYFALLFPPAELVEFLEANQMSRPLTIRTNTLKTKRRELAQALIQRGVNLDPVGDWSKVGLKILDSQVPIGATPEYLAGYYMLQAASSFLPVMALAPQQGEKVLDMAAAPGGKTTHIAQLMRNTGVLFSNDINEDRIAGLRGNIQRLGVTNCIITNYDGRKFPKLMTGFDRVLLDAPCSGLGVIAKDQSIKTHRTVEDIKKNAHLQKELLLAAIDCCNSKSSTGGFIVYSTCSVSIEENEEVVQYALNNRRVKLVDTGLGIGSDGFYRFRAKVFDRKMQLCRRIYPHVHNMDGFFVAKLRKCENAIPEGASKPQTGAKRPRLREKGKHRAPELVPMDVVENSEDETTQKAEDAPETAKPKAAITHKEKKLKGAKSLARDSEETTAQPDTATAPKKHKTAKPPTAPDTILPATEATVPKKHKAQSDSPSPRKHSKPSPSS